jgi:hypothetical protein
MFDRTRGSLVATTATRPRWMHMDCDMHWCVAWHQGFTQAAQLRRRQGGRGFEPSEQQHNTRTCWCFCRPSVCCCCAAASSASISTRTMH